MSTTNAHSTAESQTARPTRVWINSWQNARRVQVLPDQVALQVTVPSCSHCHTCQSRVQQFKGTLADKPEVIHQWKTQEGAYWLFLPRREEQNPLDLLRNTLGIRVSAS